MKPLINPSLMCMDFLAVRDQITTLNTRADIATKSDFDTITISRIKNHKITYQFLFSSSFSLSSTSRLRSSIIAGSLTYLAQFFNRNISAVVSGG